MLIKYGPVLDATSDVLPFITEYNDKNAHKQLLQSGDVIIADTAEDEAVGKATEIINVGTRKVVSGLHTIACRPRVEMTPTYLGFYINSETYHQQLYSLMQGVKVLSISKSNIEGTTLCYPTEAEQQKICGLLNLIELRIVKQRQLIEHLKKYKRGVYKSIFANSRLDCKWISLGELCEIITKGTTPQSFLTEGTIRYIKIESIVDGHIVNENCKFIDQDTHEGALSRSILKEGDILFSIAGSLGVCVIVQPSNLPANTNQALAIIRLKETENRNYILSVLRSSLMEEYILASRTTGAQPNLSLQQMRDFKLPYPNSDEQQKIALLAELMEKRLSFEQRKLENLIDIKSALLQQLFI